MLYSYILQEQIPEVGDPPPEGSHQQCPLDDLTVPGGSPSQAYVKVQDTSSKQLPKVILLQVSEYL